ncbi:MAG: hydroxymethylbilane synthase [Deltaproteobacteria bacterium]
MEVKERLIIGTRSSALALWQAEWVKAELLRRYPGVEVRLERIKTTGDKILDVPLARVGGKGLFVKEIEEALEDGRVDLAVHSMKDVPTVFPKGLHLKAITKREDARDAVISRSGVRLKDLPMGASIGTSSLRRQSQILNMRPDFQIQSLRGNLDTRIRKLEEGRFDAVILACAGIKRLGLEAKITELLDPEVCLPAIGQGALGIETRIEDEDANEMAAFFNHPDSSVAVRAERAFLKRLEGGCQVPIAAHAEVRGDGVKLIGLVASVDGKKIVKDSASGSRLDAEDIGVDLAEKLLRSGAWEILKDLYEVKPPGGA